MQYTKLIVYVLLVMISSCSSFPSQYNLQHKPLSLDVDERALNEGVLRIYLPEEVPKNLAIQAPNDEWFVLQETEESIEVMSQAHFETLKVMEFQIENLKGVTWRESKRVTELVFKVPGTYLVYFADNLETEPSNTFNLQKSINFRK